MRCPPALGLRPRSCWRSARPRAARTSRGCPPPARRPTAPATSARCAPRPAPCGCPAACRSRSCLRRVRTDAQLQELGTLVHARRRGPRAGAPTAATRPPPRQLGYLIGAVAAGAERSNGISAELARRVAIAGTRLGDDPELARRAGRRRRRRARRAGERRCGCASTTPPTARASPTARPAPGRRSILVHSAGAQPPRVRAARRGARAPLPARAARPAAARRLRGPPAPPLHPRLAGRGARRVLPRRRRPRGRSSAATALGADLLVRGDRARPAAARAGSC